VVQLFRAHRVIYGGCEMTVALCAPSWKCESEVLGKKTANWFMGSIKER